MSHRLHRIIFNNDCVMTCEMTTEEFLLLIDLGEENPRGLIAFLTILRGRKSLRLLNELKHNYGIKEQYHGIIDDWLMNDEKHIWWSTRCRCSERGK